jgi:hypothetical protein
MQRAILLSCATAFLAMVCIAADEAPHIKTSAESLGLHGRVRTLHSEMWLRPEQNPATAPFTTDDWTYDQDGWVVEHVGRVNGVERNHTTYRRSGRIILQQDTFYAHYPNADPPNTSSARRELLTNDERGRPVELLIYDGIGQLLERTVRQYEPNGTRELTYDGKGKLLDDRFRVTTVTKKNETVVTETTANGKVENVVTDRQNGAETHKESVFYAENGDVVSRSVWNNNPQQTQSAMTRKDGAGVAYTKDAAGNSIQIVDDTSGGRMITTSGPTGESKIEHYGRDGKLQNTITNDPPSELDEHGNWLRGTQYYTSPNGITVLNTVTKRTITYY